MKTRGIVKAKEIVQPLQNKESLQTLIAVILN
jgi:hypothetical protein